MHLWRPRLGVEGRRAARHAILVVLWLAAAWWAFRLISLGPRAAGDWLGVDAFAYWYAFEHNLYEPDAVAPQTNLSNRYLYSPLFAQLLWPLAQLPWQVFAILWSGLSAAIFLWVLRPLPWLWRVPVFVLLCMEEVIMGNVRALITLALVVALRYPAAWAVPALTKVASAVGVLWHVVRGEWRACVTVGLTVAGVVGLSFAIAPDLWLSWFRYLGEVDPADGIAFYAFRLPLAVLLVVVAAITGRPVWLAPATAIASPVIYLLADVSYLAAVPRLLDQRTEGVEYLQKHRRREDQPDGQDRPK